MNPFLNELTEIIKNNERFILMAHKNIDLDAFGSMLCLSQIITSFNKECLIIINKKVNESVNKAKQRIEKTEQKFNFVSRIRGLNEKDIIIIIDVHKPEMIEIPSILKKTNNIIVIDHHIKNKNYIKNTIFTYLNNAASSTVEIMISYLKYLNKRVSPLVATIMLTGIEIDTNSFSIKTTANTYETAAYLTELGADNTIKKELLQENKDEYLKRQDFIEKAIVINQNIAICTMDQKIYSKEDLSIIAAELLQFESIEASFTIGKIASDTVGISAKSLDNIDVERIMSYLGGGGHPSNAATQIKDKTINQVKEELIEILNRKE